MAALFAARFKRVVGVSTPFLRNNPGLLLKSRLLFVPSNSLFIKSDTSVTFVPKISNFPKSVSSVPTICSAFQPSLVWFLRPYRSKSDKPSKPLPIKVVCSMDLSQISISDYESCIKKISYCFPFVDFIAGSSMRRTVVTGEFSLERSFVFVAVGFGNKWNIELLASTESTKCVGVRFGAKLVIFENSVFVIKDLDLMCGVEKSCIALAEVNLPDEQKYLLPNFTDFKKALEFVEGFVKQPNMFPNSFEGRKKKSFLENCLRFLFDICFCGVVFRSTFVDVKISLSLTGKKGTPVDVLTNKDWLKMSDYWYSGIKTYPIEEGFDDCFIEDFISVVKAPPMVVQPVGQYNPEHQKARLQQKAEIAFSDRVRGFEESKRVAAQKAWSAARGGVDYGQFFDEEKFGSVDDEVVARDAFKESFVLYFR